MRKANAIGVRTQDVLLPAYGRKKLLGYADSFHVLAKTFTYRGETDEGEMSDRETSLFKKRLLEDREILADNLKEVARIIRTMAEETYHFYPLKAKEQKKIVHACKENGILVREIYQAEEDESGLKLAVELCVDDRHVMTAEDAAELLSFLFKRKLLPEKDSLFFLSKEYEMILFEEEPSFNVLTGAAKATRENEKVSGDTYCFIEKGNGGITMALSDGMGSGEKAMGDSETVIDLLEKLLESGFSKEVAVEMINGVLVARCEEENMSTLDICDINLYTGECEMMKIGSSYTYIKQDDIVEQIAADNLPLGIFHKMEVDKQVCRLRDGDFIIMVSDGIIDGVGNEDLFREVLSQMDVQNPQEMANYILRFVLHRTKGKIQDDMTVLTLGIWENASL
ncbi:SpoIIE family protein phosphatase [Lachnospiraceae bacterium JLR.KK008]